MGKIKREEEKRRMGAYPRTFPPAPIFALVKKFTEKFGGLMEFIYFCR
jgi:hypothetical protein